MTHSCLLIYYFIISFCYAPVINHFNIPGKVYDMLVRLTGDTLPVLKDPEQSYRQGVRRYVKPVVAQVEGIKPSGLSDEKADTNALKKVMTLDKIESTESDSEQYVDAAGSREELQKYIDSYNANKKIVKEVPPINNRMPSTSTDTNALKKNKIQKVIDKADSTESDSEQYVDAAGSREELQKYIDSYNANKKIVKEVPPINNRMPSTSTDTNALKKNKIQKVIDKADSTESDIRTICIDAAGSREELQKYIDSYNANQEKVAPIR